LDPKAIRVSEMAAAQSCTEPYRCHKAGSGGGP
jgi:hypothetical protein